MEKVTFQQKFEGDEGVSHTGICGKSSFGRTNSSTKA